MNNLLQRRQRQATDDCCFLVLSCTINREQKDVNWFSMLGSTLPLVLSVLFACIFVRVMQNANTGKAKLEV